MEHDTSGYHIEQLPSYFSISLTKYHDQGNL